MSYNEALIRFELYIEIYSSLSEAYTKYIKNNKIRISYLDRIERKYNLNILQL